MFELASIGIAQADPNTGRWLRVNQKMCDITGYSAGEMLLMRVPEITHPEDRQRDWEAFQRVVRGETPGYRLEKRYVRKNGSSVWVNVNMTVLRDTAGRPVRTVAAIEDITERKQAEERIRRLSRTLAMLSDINQAIVRIRDLQALFEQAAVLLLKKAISPWRGSDCLMIPAKNYERLHLPVKLPAIWNKSVFHYRMKSGAIARLTVLCVKERTSSAT